jgi:hypothetical protein
MSAVRRWKLSLLLGRVAYKIIVRELFRDAGLTTFADFRTRWLPINTRRQSTLWR